MTTSPPKFTNRLSSETSPYLLQHAHNPVDWYPWGEEALQKAKAENKVLLVSIGYAACHWCHVMERESFEDEATAQLMNELYVNVKIDREERPDLDHIYMEAVQAMTGSGGWPLNIFLTPEQKPFYGGTYFPPVPAHGRSSWKDVLISMADAWQRKRSEIEAQAEKLLEHIQNSSSFVGKINLLPVNKDGLVSKEDIDTMRENLLSAADKQEGGFGSAPKFLQTQSIKFLLHHFYYFKDEAALAQAELSLQKMLFGGIYDQIGGGISRYSTDAHWLVPHFEKMLYDNALLLDVLAHAYSITKKPLYKFYLEHAYKFLIKELKAETGGFHAALDADSEGIEGKFYLWEKSEIENILGDEATYLIKHFNIQPDGNVPVEHPYWKGKNVLHRSNFPESTDLGKLNKSIQELYIHRAKRIAPATDNKIIMGWNGLLLTALCTSYSATGDEEYKQEAIKLADSIKKLFSKKDGSFHHSFAKGTAKHNAYLDDLAYYTHGLLQLQEITNDVNYLEQARQITEYIFKYFFDASDNYCFYSSSEQTDIIVRKKEFYDSAMTAANAVLAENLYKLGAYYQEECWTSTSEKMMVGLNEIVKKHPTSFATWAVLSQNLLIGLNETAVVGDDHLNQLVNISKIYSPFRILMGAATPDEEWPLLMHAKSSSNTYIYLCRNKLCFSPTQKLEDHQGALLASSLF